MNKREELETLLKEKREKQKQINQEVQKIMDKIKNLPVSNFKLQDEGNGWYIDEFGEAQSHSSADYFPNEIIENYNYFTSKEYAKKVAFKQYFERKLLAYKDKHGDKCDWNDKCISTYICYMSDHGIMISTNYEYKDSNINFNSKDLLLKHIEENKEEWLRYFNVCKELD